MADTLSANLAEVTQEIIASTIAIMPQQAPMLNLVTRLTIPKGHDRIEIPRDNATFSVTLPTEGDEIVNSSQYDLTSTTIQPTLRAIMIRVSGRAEYFSRDDVVAAVSRTLARAQGKDIDTDLTAEFANFAAGNDVGTTNTNLTLAVLAQAKLNLLKVADTAGGSPNPPYYCVLAPIPEFDVFTNLGLSGSLGSNYIPSGLSEDVIRNYGIPQNRIVGVEFFRDNYMTEDGSADFICGMFSKEAMHFAVSKDWDMKTFDVPNWIGPVIRSVADYNSGIGAFTAWGVQITADGA